MGKNARDPKPKANEISCIKQLYQMEMKILSDIKKGYLDTARNK